MPQPHASHSMPQPHASHSMNPIAAAAAAAAVVSSTHQSHGCKGWKPHAGTPLHSARGRSSTHRGWTAPRERVSTLFVPTCPLSFDIPACASRSARARPDFPHGNSDCLLTCNPTPVPGLACQPQPCEHPQLLLTTQLVGLGV
jgi:hypothetical protein